MKKTGICLFLGLLICVTGFSQRELQKAIHKYYRYDPFERSFSNFISNLLSDPALINKTVVKRTDSTLFFFKGEYKGHNPFGFTAIRTEVRLAEMEIEASDSSSRKDTILAYQILGYVNRTENGIASVKNELEKFDRKYGPSFFTKNSNDLQQGGHIAGFTSDYFLNNSLLSPLTVLWGNVGSNESLFGITIRMSKTENQAVLPLSVDKPGSSNSN